MAINNMTIRFTPDGFSFTKSTDLSSTAEEESFFEIAPGPDFQSRLQAQVLDQLPATEQLLDLSCQFISTRFIVLPPHVTDVETASSMYRVTLSESETPEEILLQHIALPTGQEVTICFGIDRELYLFLMRNFGEVSFCHHIATLLTEGARKAQGNCLVVRCDAQYLELALFRSGALHLVNAYHTSQSEHRSYYVMNTWTQQGLDQLQDFLLVLGNSNEALQVRASLHRFIKHVFS